MNPERDSRPAGNVFIALAQAWKLYGNFAALKGADLELRRGEVHMLLGENGAGKSTIVSLITGINTIDRGTLKIEGVEVPGYSPALARTKGVNAVLQDFSLIPNLTIAENFFLGREIEKRGILSKAAMRQAAQKAVNTLGVPLDVRRKVAGLRRAEQQILEIVRAIDGHPGLLILDEPTATLSHEESNRLFSIVDRLRAENWSILYITHRMDEMRRLGDRVTVLRDGQTIATHALAEVTDAELIAQMVGRSLDNYFPQIAHAPGETLLEFCDASTPDGLLKHVNLDIRAGEIVGVGGLLGSGKGEIGRYLYGLSDSAGGFVRVRGKPLARKTPQSCLSNQVIYLPQDRRGEALILGRSIAENITVEILNSKACGSRGILFAHRIGKVVVGFMEALDIRPRNPAIVVGALSGGNQQKVVLARALTRPRAVYIFDEPTAGVDIGARHDFYVQLKKICESGAGVLLITSELQELIGLAHRIYVMHDGKVTGQLCAADRTQENVARLAFGEALAV